MTVRYELRKVGVFDRELGAHVRPADAGWGDYTRWLAAGNVPDPMPPPPPPPERPTEPVPGVLALRVAAAQDAAREALAATAQEAPERELLELAVAVLNSRTLQRLVAEG